MDGSFPPFSPAMPYPVVADYSACALGGSAPRYGGSRSDKADNAVPPSQCGTTQIEICHYSHTVYCMVIQYHCMEGLVLIRLTPLLLQVNVTLHK